MSTTKTRAVLIDPDAQTVTEGYVGLSLEELRRWMQCDTISVFRFLDHSVYHDDEALLSSGVKPFTVFADGDSVTHPIIGRMVVCGLPDGDGEDTPCTLSVDEIRAEIASFGLVELAG